MSVDWSREVRAAVAFMSSAGCTCADGAERVDGQDGWSVGRHLSSCMIGPAASSTSLLNEWLLIRTLQLAGAELPDQISPPPVQYAMVLPSLQLLSFIVCRSADSSRVPRPSSSRYHYGAHDVVVIVRDCRAKRVWRMRQCYGPKATPSTSIPEQQSASTAQAATHTPSPPRSPSLPPSHAPDDRFYAAWLSSREQQHAMTDKTPLAPSVANTAATISTSTSASITSAATAAPSSTSGPPSFSSNLRSAIAAARAKSPPFASSLGSSGTRHSTWKAAPQPFSLFDAWGEAEAWLNTQQHTSEHEQYMRCVQEQMAACAQQPPQPPPAPMERPSVQYQPVDVGDGWSELHALLHHLGFFSSLLPTDAESASALFPYPLSPSAFSLPSSPAGISNSSLLLLHPSAALTDSIDELDAISDTQLHRVMLLTRRTQQTSEWDMMTNSSEMSSEEQREDDNGSKVQDACGSKEALSSLLSSLSDLSSRGRQSEQLVWFVPSRLCPALLSQAVNSTLPQSTDTRWPAVWVSLLSACAVRVVWCEGEADYVSPHRQRQRDRRQKRRARETGDGDGALGIHETSRSVAPASPHNSPDDTAVAISASSQPPYPTALIYVVVSFHPADGTYRVRVDCDWRLRNKQRKIESQLPHSRSQSHSNAIIAASSAVGAMHSSRWLPPPLVKSNSLSNTQPQPPSSATSTGTVFKSLFKRLGSRSARFNGQPSDHLSVSDGRRSGGSSTTAGSRTNSLSPARSSSASSSIFAARRSPRHGHIPRQESEGGVAAQHHHYQQQQQQQQQHAERRRSERADALLRHPVLSQPFPPAECAVGVEGLAARLFDTVLLSARRVQAWREWRSLARRRHQAEAHNRHNGPNRRPEEWGRSYEVDHNSVPQRGVSSVASVAMSERSRLLREIVREHGELVTPAAFFESVFGQQMQAAATQG